MSSMTKWAIDPQHTTIAFAVRHLMISTVKGRFGEVEGAVHLNLEDPGTAEVTVRIPAASIDTRSPDRDAHLRSADFLDVAQHPDITFWSTRVEAAGKQSYRLTGDLTIHGVTRPVTLNAEFTGTVRDPWGGTRAGFTASGKINRHDFGLNWNAALESGGVLVGPEVKLEVEVELVAVAGGQAEAA